MRSMRSACTELLALITVAWLAACGGAAGNFPAGSFERGEIEFQDENFLDAIDDLKLFIRRNPTDDRSDDAQLMIARAYMAKEDYPVAAVELEILRKDYPDSPLFDEAYYLQGLCYAEQVPRIELHQEVTRDAIVHFERYLRDQSEGAYRPQAEQQIADLRLHLDEKLMSAVRLYLRRGHWSSAEIYLESFVAERPQSQLMPEALYLQAGLRAREDGAAAALPLYQELAQRFPDSSFAGKAREKLSSSVGSGGDG